MPSTHRYVLAGLGAVLALATALPASAQQTPIINSVTGRNDNAVMNLKDYPINAEECDAADSPVISITFKNIPDKSVLDFWRGTSGTNCTDTANRDNSQGGDTKCKHLSPGTSLSINGLAQKTLEFPIRDLLDADDDGVCDATTADYVIYVLAVDEAGTAETAGESWSFNLSVDTDPPSPPTGVKGGSGDTQISVSWSRQSENLKEYRIYALPNACTNGTYVGGADTDAASDADGGAKDGWTLVKKGIASSASSENVSGSALGLEYGQEAAVAVTAKDLAGNESDLSTPACVSRVRTTGFCSSLTASGGKCESCGVTAPGHTTRGGMALWAVLGLGLVFAVRRRFA